jgi:polysaccharide biosynthesis transport protein
MPVDANTRVIIMTEQNNAGSFGVSADGGTRTQINPATARATSQALPVKPLLRAAAHDQALTASLVLAAVRRWWKVVTPLAVVLSCASAMAVHLLTKPQYDAAAWLRIEEKTPFLAYETRIDDRSRAFFQTQVEMIRSPVILDVAAQCPEIAALPGMAENTDKSSSLARRIQVNAVGESELFNIHFTDSDPSRAAAVVNAITTTYLALRDKSDSDRTQFVLELLVQDKTTRAAEVARLREALEAMARQVVGQNPLSTNTKADSDANRSLSELQNRLILAQVERTMLAAKLKAAEASATDAAGAGSALARGASAGPERAVLTPGEIELKDAITAALVEESPEVKQELASIITQQEKLRQIQSLAAQGEDDLDYIRIKAAIAAAQDTLEDLRDKARPRVEKQAEAQLVAKRAEARSATAIKHSDEIASMKSELEGRQTLERKMAEQYQQALKDARQASGDALLLEFKREELARAEKVVELISQRILQLQTERGAPARVSLLKLAEPPSEPTLSAKRNTLLAAFAGLFAPFLIAVGWERMVRRVGELDDLQRSPSLAICGEIAKLPGRSLIAGRRGVARAESAARLFEESVDSLRTRLMLSEGLKEARLLAITSAVDHEGKTSVASQLALSLARASGERVLLIDGDMRSPKIHRLFGVSREPGLVRVLAGECSLDEAIVATDKDCVFVLPAGRLSRNPYRLLSNGTWKSLLAKISSEYRYVVIDTAPILSASESLVLAKAADAAIVCAMRDVSRVDQVSEACDRLTAAGGRPVGLVLNGVPGSRYLSRYGSYAYDSAQP